MQSASFLPEVTASGLSAVIALIALIYAVWARHRNTVEGAIRDVRRVAVVNIETFNGIMNKALVGAEPEPTDLAELARLYAETRQAFQVNRHHFWKGTRRKVDGMIDAIEREFIEEQAVTQSLLRQWFDLMKFVERKTR